LEKAQHAASAERGMVPAVLYGDGEAPRHVSLNDHDLTQALKQPKVILEIDFDNDVGPHRAAGCPARCREGAS
jgi:large subunit ribosomal protein L25